MRKQITRNLFFVLMLLTQYNFAQAQQPLPGKAEVITGKLIKVTKPLRNFKTPSNWVDVQVRDENGVIWPEGKKPIPFVPSYFPDQQQNADASLQQQYNTTSNNTERAVGVNINGIGYSSVNPPDPTMCAGPNHIVQMINGNSGALIKISNKSGGQLLAQTFLDQITGRGGLGDPIALYDQLADRFVMLEFAARAENSNTEGLIIAVSQTADPTGAWFVYFFGYGTTFPDYPKLSVWNDAYYCTTNDFANQSAYTGSSAWAFNRAQMIAGNATAQSQRFTLGNTNKYFSMCPVLLQGTTTPPAGTGGLIAYMADDAWTSSTADVDSIGLLEFKVNFSNAAATTITHKATLATAAYKSDICTATRGRCISQPGSTIALEALQQKVMNQPIYRNFGGFEGIVLTHIVDKGSNISGLRWYELKKTTGNWGITQQSTYAPDNTHRWMPSVCYDKFGNIALAYNVSSSATGVFPGVRYTGRKECDALNTMTYSEDVIVAGTAANASNRYGDYNHLVADPDGVTFWFTAQWNGASQWSTRITSFTLDECTPAACADPSGLSSSVTTTIATVGWNAVSGANSYDIDYKLSSSATWTNAATGTTATSVNLTGLTSATTYDWRVRANCTAGSSNYVQAQFTTQSVAVCNTPTGLSSSGITTTGATVNWSAISGANNYDVDYKLSSSATWINAATAITSTSVAISGLSVSTIYDWRVRANCASGSSAYAQAQFTTASVVTCPGVYDVSANGTRGGAAAIPFSTDVFGLISPSGDNDYYRFTITTTGTFSVTLNNLPFDYDLRLYRNNTQVAISQNGGTTGETINYTATQTGTYYARVYGYNGANSSTQCYRLRVTLGTATAPELNDVFTGKTAVSLFPNPVQQKLSVSIKGDDNTKNIVVFDVNGRMMLNQPAMGIITTLDVQKLPAGIYFLKVISQDGALLHQEKFVKQ